MTTAVLRSKARMPRKSSFSAPGTIMADQFLPLSMVRSMVPSVPLAQTVVGLTTLSPRRLAVVGTVTFVHWARAVVAKKRMTERRRFIIFQRLTDYRFNSAILSEAPLEFFTDGADRREVEGSRECLQHECSIKAFSRSNIERTP